MNRLLFFLLSMLLLSSQEEEAYRKARQRMVDYQIRARGVHDAAVLDAMRTIPRHLFVPDEFRRYAYDDTPLYIGNDQTISQPYMVAFMTQAIVPVHGQRVLEIGTGSGYQAAVLAEIVDTVFTIEIIDALLQQAKQRLDSLGYTNVICRSGDGYHGWKEKGPFDAIIVTAAPEKVPQRLLDQLAEGGRMVIPVGSVSTTQKLVLLTNIRGKIYREELMHVRFVPFIRSDTLE